MAIDVPDISCSEIGERLTALFGAPHADLGTVRWAVRPPGESVAVHVLISDGDSGMPCSVWVFDPRFTAETPAQRFRVGTRDELEALVRTIRELVS